MRLLMTADTVGGVWTFAKELAAGLLSQGCEVLLVSFGGEASSEQQQDTCKLAASGAFQYICSNVALEWMPLNEEAYRAAAPMLLRLCAQFRPDALLLSQFCFGALPVSVPKIVIAHSDVLSWAAAIGKAPLEDDPWLRQYQALIGHGLKGADLLVAPTRSTLRAMCMHLELPQKTVVIGNGRSLPVESTAETRQMRAVTAGRMWDPAKNLALLCNVESPIPMLVAGDHQAETINTRGLTMLGRQSEAELLALFRTSAMYICCSVYEPFGLAPLEAALCSCAVLANDIPTLREVWDDGALYFHDAPTLSQLMRNLADRPEMLLGAQKRSLARAQQYTTARMVDGYLRQIADVIADRQGGSARAA